MEKIIKWFAIFLLCKAITMGGCSTAPRPFEYRPDHELKKGPGLFSGEEGMFTIYGNTSSTEKVSDKQGQIAW